ncbi:hypothetical protein F3087_43930 [Nocardia colli]|uniref:Uncharacterized protein n=1 Tax=Nocardia colli TaxID=2545717 RepID=A0A5N0DK74_9NOCA|nr:hypothetical protein [Nocardia colli]KAA8877457.1 hypothetical protein F3087_43930 [Nocardia colli]
MCDREMERTAIRAAMQRLIDGTAYRSTGALNVLQLAAEAGVKRWLLTHKHTDLAEEFRTRIRAGTEPASPLHRSTRRAEAAEHANQALREDNARLRAQIAVYAQVIHELRTELAGPRIRHGLDIIRELPKR